MQPTRNIVYVAGEKGVYRDAERGWVWVTGPDVKPHVTGIRELKGYEYIEIPKPEDAILLRMADKAVINVLVQARKLGLA